MSAPLAAVTNTKKRRTDPTVLSGRGASAKKAHGAGLSAAGCAHARSLVSAVLAEPEEWAAEMGADELRNKAVLLAQYARELEGEADASVPAPAPPAEKTPAELERMAESMRHAANRGIRSQMKWKPSCKQGAAKWVYDGVALDPKAFSMMLNLGSSKPTFKAKKMSTTDFVNAIGRLEASVRYDTLSVTKDTVNIKWNEATGEFKFSGTYGL